MRSTLAHAKIQVVRVVSDYPSRRVESHWVDLIGNVVDCAFTANAVTSSRDSTRKLHSPIQPHVPIFNSVLRAIAKSRRYSAPFRSSKQIIHLILSAGVDRESPTEVIVRQ